MLKNYFLIACKVYMRRKLFTAINLLCIVLTLMVLLVVTAILQTTFYPTGVEGKSERFLQANTLVSLGTGKQWRSGPLGYKVIDQYLRKMKTPELVAAVTSPSAVSVYQADRVTEVMLRRADAEYWKILDFKVLSGRVPSAEDVAQGRFVAVLNASTAKKLFADAQALGQKLNVGGQQFEVIGVVEDVLHLNAYAEIWVPVTTFPSTEYKNQLWGEFTALLMAKDAAGLALIQEEIQQVAKSLPSADPNIWRTSLLWADTKLDFFAREIMNTRRVADSGATGLLAVIAGLMLLFMLLPALNLVNLNAGRIMERSAEIGVRKAFGASSMELIGQFVMENVLLCLLGGLIALLGAKGVLFWLGHSGLVPYMQVDLNWTVFCYGLLITLVFGLLSGVIPAWKMSRLDPVLALKGGA